MTPNELVSRICMKILENATRTRLNDLDAVCGDGETGTNLSRGAKLVLEKVKTMEEFSFRKIGMALNSAGCGTLGTLWSFLLMRLGSATNLGEGMVILRGGLHDHSAARKGDKTMVDALLPWIESLENGSSWDDAAEKARGGAMSTVNMPSQRGRGKYVGDKSLGIIDPGAYATALVLSEVSEFFKTREDPEREAK